MAWPSQISTKPDFDRCILPPYAHQKKGVVRLMENPRYGLFWEMRLGKTKAVIDAACFLKARGELDAVLLVCPAQVKDVWGHPELGEVKKHAFEPWRLLEMDSSNNDYVDVLAQSVKQELLFLSISHEYLRQEDRHSEFPHVAELKQALQGKKIWIVVDEAAAFGTYKSLQTKSAMSLMDKLAPERRTLLDGTPIGNSPIEQYSKFNLLGQDILGYKSFFHFRAVHQVKQTNQFAKRGVEYVSFKNQDWIDRKVRAFCEYLEQKDCLDMPEKVGSFLTVRLTPKQWRLYCDMRDDMVAQLDSGEMSAQHASVKSLRLSQICAGFAGGVENEITGEIQTIETSTETLDATMDWLASRYSENLGFKCVLWVRWRPEIERLVRAIQNTKAFFTKVRMSYGAKKDYADELHPDHPYDGPLVLVAQQQSLRYGVNLSKAGTELFVSQDYNRVTRAQAVERLQAPITEDRCRQTTLVVDMLATGPHGERTITWDIKRSLDGKEEVARRTAGEWKRILLEK